MAGEYYGALNRPLSAQQLKQEALDYPYSDHRSLQTWLRAASRLLIQARLYEREKDIQSAFIYIYRHTDLILYKIPRHPDYRDPAFRYDLREAREDVRENLPKLERWKPKLNQVYRDYLLAAELEFHEETQLLDDDADVHAELARQSNRDSARREHRSDRSEATTSRYFSPREPRRHSSPAVEPPRRIIYRYPSPPRRHTRIISPPRLSNPTSPSQHSLPPPSSLSSYRPSLPPRPTPNPPQIHLPTTLIPLFLSAAHTNTLQQIETCALLAGYLSPSPSLTWHITTLLLFNQTGTATTCTETTSGALQIHSSLQASGLAVCGWIHTHPRHGCFLSSIDLHTQAWWQAENSSAVAVVVDPFEMEENPGVGTGWDVYRLTGVGMQVVKGCEVGPGEFHTHVGWDREELYESAVGRGGHCILVEGVECVVDDRREE